MRTEKPRCFTPALPSPARVGMEATCDRPVVRESAARTSSRTMDRRRGGDSCRHGAQAEDGLARCPTYSGLAVDEPFSPHLGTVASGAGFAADAAASTQTGALSNFGDEPIARIGHGARSLPKEKTVERKLAGRNWKALVLDPWASLRRKELLQLLDQLDPWINKLDRGGDPGSREGHPAGQCLMTAARRGAGDSTSVCADHRASQPLCEQQTSGELSGFESQ